MSEVMFYSSFSVQFPGFRSCEIRCEGVVFLSSVVPSQAVTTCWSEHRAFSHHALIMITNDTFCRHFYRFIHNCFLQERNVTCKRTKTGCCGGNSGETLTINNFISHMLVKIMARVEQVINSRSRRSLTRHRTKTTFEFIPTRKMSIPGKQNPRKLKFGDV